MIAPASDLYRAGMHLLSALGLVLFGLLWAVKATLEGLKLTCSAPSAGTLQTCYASFDQLTWGFSILVFLAFEGLAFFVFYRGMRSKLPSSS